MAVQRYLSFVLMAMLIAAGSQIALAQTQPLVCDATGDRIVDRNDINLIAAALNKPSSSAADVRDPDRDGKITIADVRTCTQRCTRLGCGTTNLPPKADAGPDQTVARNTNVRLNGANSTDVDLGAGTLTYLWSFVQRPAGSTSVIANSGSVTDAKFVADVPGLFRLKLTVTDPQGAKGEDTVDISTSNSAPVANAGPDATRPLGSTVKLNGTQSSDIDGDRLTFAWTLKTKPALSAATLLNATSAEPSFIADKPGNYTLSLVVSDGFLNSQVDEVVISTANSPPAANAGNAQSLPAARTVMLDGSKSFDVDGHPIVSYAWTLVSIPPGSTATLSDPNIAKPQFFADKVGTYVAELVVNDGLLGSTPATVQISTSNIAPNAHAGDDQSVAVGVEVQLDGTRSTDTDGHTLTFRWSITQNPGGASLSSTTATRPRFTPTVPGIYIVQLVVNDGFVDSAPDTAIIAVGVGNLAPIAEAGPAQGFVVLGATVRLDGRQSGDPDNGPQPLTYRWSLSKPIGSGATLANDKTATPSFVPDVLGTYVAQLIVFDGAVDSVPDTITISTNSKPIANAGEDQNNVAVGATVTLDGRGSRDPDGQLLTYSWSFTSNPGNAVLDNTTSATPRFVPKTPGIYVLQVIVRDGVENSDADTVVITVVAPKPIARGDAYRTLEDTQLIVPNPGVLGNDSANGAGTLTAQKASDPASGSVTLNAGGGFTFVPAPNASGTVNFTYRAQGASGAQSDPATVAITVDSVNDAPTLDAIADISLKQNAGTRTVNLTSITAGPADESTQSVTIQSTSSDTSVIPHPTLEYTSPNTTGKLNFTPVANAAGNVLITVRVTDSGGTANGGKNSVARTFNVNISREQDFTLSASPATQTLIHGSQAVYELNLASTGNQPFTGLANLRVVNPPVGITATLGQSALVLGQSASLTLGADSSAGTGLRTLDIEGQAVLSGVPVVRSTKITVELKSASGQTGVKGRFVTPDGRGIAGVRIAVGNTVTTSDTAGNFLLTGLQSGETTLRMDATPANPLYPIWPIKINATSNQIAQLPDWTINPPPSDDKFVAISNATQAQIITDPRYPGLSITLPAGVIITGWDGTPKKRIAVEQVDIAKLPVPPPPAPVGTAYQIYFGTPMGGVPSARIPVNLPNDSGQEPGKPVDVWYFDGVPTGNVNTGKWTQMKDAAVISADGKTAVMKPGEGIPSFCGVCGLLCIGKQIENLPTDQGKPCPDSKCTGEVNLYSGQMTPSMPGMSFGGLTPASTGMRYNPTDPYNNVGGTEGSIGHGWALDQDVAFLPYEGKQKTLVLPPDQHVDLTEQSDGSYKSFDDPRLGGAIMRRTDTVNNKWELTFKDKTVWKFSPFPGVNDFIRNGPPLFLTDVAEPAGRTLSIERQTNGRITRIGTAGRGIEMTYGGNGFISRMTDSLGRVLSLTYNGDKRIETVTDPDSKVMQYTYVGDGEAWPAVCNAQPSHGQRIKTVSYPGRSKATENFYGASRRVLRQVAYNGLEYRFAYRVVGACVVNTSTPNTRCTAINCPDVDSLENQQAGWRLYGGTVVATTVTRPNGSQYTYEFNNKGQITRTIYPLGHRTTVVYDNAQRPVQYTDALGRTSTVQYDAVGNVTQMVDPLGRIIQIAYDPQWNKPTRITRFDDANQPQTWSFTYHSTQGTLLTFTNPLNETTTFTHTSRGEVASIKDALNHLTRFSYNADGDLTQFTDPLGNVARFGFDAAGRTTGATDPLGFVTRWQYNGVDQTTKITDARQENTQLAFDPAQRLRSVTNAHGNAIESYAYDSGDRLTARTDAKNKNTSYEYDTAGRLTSKTDRKGVKTSYAYDERNRIVAITRPEGVTRYAYDAVGRVTSITDPVGSINYQYDNVDRLVKEIQVAAGITTEVVYAYDPLDRRISRTVNGLPGETTTYAYDRANRLASITYRGDVTSYRYDTAGRLIEKVLPNGIKQRLSFDDANRLTELHYTKTDNTVIEVIGYGYDAASRRTSQTSTQTILPDATFTASYDETDRMTRITLTITGKTYDLSYDSNGNLAEKANIANTSDRTSYTWDSRNRLVRLQALGMNASFDYDALGRRVVRTVNGVATRYLYDGIQALGEIANGGQASLLTGLVVDEAIARYTTFGKRIYLTSALGSIISQTQDDQSLVNRYSYSAYGESASIGSDDGNSTEYTGRENDETELYYYRARYYNPGLKRFLSEDPIGLSGGINPYTYVNGNPNTFIDPFGTLLHVPVLIGIGIAEIIFGGFGIVSQTPWHTERNQNNRCPLRPPLTTNSCDERGAWSGWEPDNPITAAHFHGNPNEGYQTFRHPSLKSQCTYKNGVLDDSSGNMGTYDHFSPKNNPIGHFLGDVVPDGRLIPGSSFDFYPSQYTPGLTKPYYPPTN